MEGVRRRRVARDRTARRQHELVLPWSSMGTALALAAVVGVIAAVAPAIRAARLNLLGAIAHD